MCLPLEITDIIYLCLHCAYGVVLTKQARNLSYMLAGKYDYVMTGAHKGKERSTAIY